MYIPEEPRGWLVGKNSSRARLERSALGHRHSDGATIRRIESAVQTLADSHHRGVISRGMNEPENQNAADRSSKGRRKHDSGFQRIPKPPKPRRARLENPEARPRLVFPDASNDLPGEPVKITWRRLLVTLQDQKPPQPFKCSRIGIHAHVKRPKHPSPQYSLHTVSTVSTWQCSILYVAVARQSNNRVVRFGFPSTGCGIARPKAAPGQASSTWASYSQH